MSNVSKGCTFVDLADDKPSELHLISVPIVSQPLATDSLSLWATIWAHLPTTELESQISNESRVFGWRVSAI